MSQINEFISDDRLERYINEAARTAGYEEGFGVRGCDLKSRQWWVAYTRQSTREQSENDRLGEYFLSCARLAKKAGVIVPREYIIYDACSSEDLNRPGMIRLRGELIAGKHISGVIISFQGRLSADPHHQLTFEKECGYYGVQVIYGDAPSGQDWASQTARLIQAQANLLRVKSNRDNALAGNIARVLAGKAPAHRIAYGYSYRAEKVIEPRTGRARVLKAWWEVNELGQDGEFVNKSAAWAVSQMFIWIADQDRTAYWVCKRLNEMGIPPPLGSSWSPKTVIKIISRICYTGKAEYNSNGRFPNPNKPLGDLTLGIKRTLIRPKPEGEKVIFDVPPLTTEDRWRRANANLRERGRGRGKQGKVIEALFRCRMICPKCGKPMSVLRDRHSKIYYYCREHYRPWIKNPCRYNRLIPGTWDEEIWTEICAMLNNDLWIEQQLKQELAQNTDIDKYVRMEQWKINQAKARIVKVQNGWENGLYIEEEARTKIAEHREAIIRSEAEIERIEANKANTSFGPADMDKLRLELKTLRDRNLNESTFEERAELIAMLGIKIMPSEDLTSRKVICRLNLLQGNSDNAITNFTKVTIGGAEGIRTPYLLNANQALSQMSYSPIMRRTLKMRI